MLSLKQITLSRASKVLLKDSSLDLFVKQKVGLIGPNGCGKSSLFQLILGNLLPDSGTYQCNNHVRISHLAQEIPDSDECALDFVLQGDTAYYQLKQRLQHAEMNSLDEEVIACHEALTQSGGYAKPALAAALMDGLGFQAETQNESVDSFSGGWRMRLNLARCLMKPADLILLDEPTNHLDMEAIIWLERWLKQSPAALLFISHDRTFLDSISTHIVHMHQQKLTLYTGNYSQFERQRAEKLTLQQQLYVKQQKKIDHMMDFVNRFKAKATKAKQAQSRIKAIEKMDMVAAVQAESPFSFEFFKSLPANPPLLRLEDVHCGYNNKPILKSINWVINPGDRIALLGPNGAGKSTFIKTLTQSIPPLSGKIEYSAKLNIGYYAQHQLEELDNNLSPVQTIQNLPEKATEQAIRTFLGGFNFHDEMALAPITHFSGGEKARLALAKLVWQKPNILFLDEPTNHLDLDMRSAIEIALQSYEGALIVISHDRYLLETTVDAFALVYQQKLTPFKGDLNDYYEWLLRKDNSAIKPIVSKDNDFKDRKTIQNRVKKLEQLMENHQQQLKKLEEQLADNALYEKKAQQTLTNLLNEQKNVKNMLAKLEEEWLDIMDT